MCVMDKRQTQTGTAQQQQQQPVELCSGEGSHTALLRLKEQEQSRALTAHREQGTLALTGSGMIVTIPAEHPAYDGS